MQESFNKFVNILRLSPDQIKNDSHKDLLENLKKVINKNKYIALDLLYNELRFKSMLDGMFTFFSDIRYNSKEDPLNVLILGEFQPGFGKRSDLLIQPISINPGSTSDAFHTMQRGQPFFLELKFDSKKKQIGEEG
ncbi:MAG: hypothetical protein KTV77_04775 [Wolbachia endosymbiont of Fragariocoptes setiger]|nr:hypothetical protein [Wolbachia endosymbiont of Fragariocoptes setiger]